jgi:hypothetical protein
LELTDPLLGPQARYRSCDPSRIVLLRHDVALDPHNGVVQIINRLD